MDRFTRECNRIKRGIKIRDNCCWCAVKRSLINLEYLFHLKDIYVTTESDKLKQKIDESNLSDIILDYRRNVEYGEMSYSNFKIFLENKYGR